MYSLYTYIRISFLVLLVMLFCGTANAEKVDSLIRKLSTLKEDTNKASLYYRISINYAHDNKDSALLMAKKCLDLSDVLHYNKGKYMAYGAFAKISLFEGNYDKALKNYLLCLEVLKMMNNKVYEANCNMNVGVILCRIGNYEKALSYYKAGLEIYTQMKDPQGMASSHNNIGIVHKNLKQYDEALKHYAIALEIGKQLKNYSFLAELYNNIAVVYEEIEPKKALEYYKLTLGLEKKIEDDYGIATTQINIGGLLSRMKQFKEALTYLESGLAYVVRVGEKDWELSAYENLSDVYTGLKNYEKANEYLYKQKQLGDSLFNETKASQLNEMQTKYDAKKKENDILVLKEQNAIASSVSEKQKLGIITISSVTVGLLLVLLLIIAFNRNRKKQKEIEFVKAKAELEQTALRAQMNPHFVFNALNSIQYYVLNKETEYAYDYLAKFSKLIRQVLINSEQNTIPLDKEIETLRLYMELEQRRFKNRFDFAIKYDNDLPTSDITVPTMLIQPFVENAIWHGIMNLDESKMGNIELSFYLKDKTLKICVEDNGIGRKEAGLRKVKNEYESVGMLFTQKRLKLLKEITKQNTEILVNDLSDDSGNSRGTKVEIFIDIIV